jgi:hypothetical protein
MDSAAFKMDGPTDIDQLIERIDRQQELRAKTTCWIALRSEFDNAVFGWECPECHGKWKIYQNEYHTGSCSKRPPKHRRKR